MAAAFKNINCVNVLTIGQASPYDASHDLRKNIYCDGTTGIRQDERYYRLSRTGHFLPWEPSACCHNQGYLTDKIGLVVLGVHKIRNRVHTAGLTCPPEIPKVIHTPNARPVKKRG